MKLSAILSTVLACLMSCSVHAEQAVIEEIEAEVEGKKPVELISGEFRIPDKKFMEEVSYKLVGQLKFSVGIGFTIHGNFDLNGHELFVNTGGGNQTTFPGVISGRGTLLWSGGGTANWQTVPSFLKGELPNTFSGTLTINNGTLAFAKKPGVDAFSGDWIILGGERNQTILRLDASDQINDSSSIRMVGKHTGRIWTQGNSEKLQQMEVLAQATIDMGDGESRLTFADCRDRKWDLTKTLTIHHWTNGKDRLVFGEGKPGLSKEQLARIGFADPDGSEPGIYSAKILPDGEVVPDVKVEPVNPPFPLTEEARKAREKLYTVPGRANLSGDGTPLKAGMTISFFGDSITWQNVYISKIGAALEKSETTRDMKINLVNHGINGGGVLSIRDGVEKSAFVSAKERNGPQAPFADVIKSDRSDVAVVYIGINDVWWRKTSPEDFEKALQDLVSTARANKTVPVLATLSVWQELPDGKNSGDPKCDQYAEITRKVAKSTGTTLIDLRQVFIAYLQNHNIELRVDGTLESTPTGFLTYDGVHPSNTGNELLADQISQGIYESLKNRK
ncbi:MAG: GDSL-type esterase/lipase family protein [Planctomycetota bacterium]|nr:GDSL-type esterase/lipase family protein [Planctomycetota bacterium]